MNCIIVEDQPPAQRILKKYIEDVDYLHLEATFSDAIQAMEFIKSQTVDLIFLDIHLPKMSGIDFLKTLPHPPHIILTTAFPDYALESYEYTVVDYLLKPFSFQRFVKALSKIPAKTSESIVSSSAPPPLPQELFIKSGYDHIKINVDDIIYIKSDADYTEIFIAEKKHLSNESLRDWLEKLNPRQFTRVHKSYIINSTKITKISGNQIFLSNEKVVPLGRAFKENFVKRFLQ